MQNRSCYRRLAMLLLLTGVAGCQNVKLTEVTGKTAFGPEFRNFGNNTSDIRYNVIQGVQFKLSNKWDLGVTYQRRDVDEGSGDNENLVLFEVGYPIWNAPKKPEKTAEEQQIEGLERELRLLDTELAAARMESPDGSSGALVQAGKVK